MKYPVIYKDWGMGEYTRGSSRGPLILIKPEYRDDEGLYQHELTHVKQWFFVTVVSALLLFALYPSVTPLAMAVWPLAYKFVPEVRLWAEVQAFKKQAKYYDDDRLTKFAHFIATRYGLDVDEDTVLKLLRR